MKESSLIKSYHYTIAQTLEIEFHNGARYDYLKVPVLTYDEFEASESLGKYFLQNIRDVYEFKKA